VEKLRKLILSNAVILEGEELEITRGYLVIKDGTVEKISEGEPSKRSTDLHGAFILPPFINSHTHLADGVAKEIYLGKRQPEVVGPEGSKFQVLNSTPEKDLAQAIALTLKDMLSTGTLAHCDFREGGVKGVKLLNQAPRGWTKSIGLGRPTSVGEAREILKYSDGIGLPSLRALPWPVMREIAKIARDQNKIFSVHVGETAEEQKASIKEFGKGEVERALELNPSFLVHATWAQEDELAPIKRAKVPLVFCPRANSLLSVGIPPLSLALKMGVKFYLGTDNACVCQPDLFQELAFAWAILRNTSPDVKGEEARQLLKAATLEPLTTFDLPWGSIQPGNPATFLVLARKNNLNYLKNIYSGIVNRARADNLKWIFVNGRQIFQNQDFLRRSG
jgi:cytosine/adenosine deaminase-related metal-dependent hydrolase